MKSAPPQSVDGYALMKLAELDAQGLRRRLAPTRRMPGGTVRRADAERLSFCDNDYLGLSWRPEVIREAGSGAAAFGAGAGASRLVAGDCPLNAAVEEAIARLKGRPAARLFGSGYLANIGVIPALVGKGDAVVLDELSHACLWAGARLSGAAVRAFAHNDAGDLRRQLADAPGRKLVVTETVFSMDGDIAPLADLAAETRAAGGWLLVDDAHGFGVVSVDAPADVVVGTLSKAVGAYGGYVCGPESLIELLAGRARSFVYSTGLPPAVLAAAAMALRIMAAEPGLGEQARARAALFCEASGLAPTGSAIVPWIVGAPHAALAAEAALAEAGFLVAAIRPPTVPAGTSRLRFTFSAAHRPDDVRRLGETVSMLRRGGT
jgi:8-amino-7-oxononanoate synthase